MIKLVPIFFPKTAKIHVYPSNILHCNINQNLPVSQIKILILRINNIKIQMYMLVYRVMIKYKSRHQQMMKSLFENVKGMHTGI